MSRQNQVEGSAFQTFSTLLALVLPVLQVFFTFLPDGSNGVFLMSDYLLVTSIIAGILSYILIIAFKNITYFEVTFARKKKKEYKEYINKIDVKAHSEAEVKKALKNPAERPFYITPHNVYYFLIPTLSILLITFLGLGIICEGTGNKALLFIQSVVYILSVSFTSLTLAVFYINESNRLNYESRESNKYSKVIDLLIHNGSLPGYPKVQFVAQKSETYDSVQTYILINDKDVYEVTTDTNLNSLKQVLPYNPAQPPSTEQSGNNNEEVEDADG